MSRQTIIMQELSLKCNVARRTPLRAFTILAASFTGVTDEELRKGAIFQARPFGISTYAIT
jgi:hypothetical protein